MTERPRRLVVGITGASGAIYGVRVLERLAELPMETHLVVSKWARMTIEHETGRSLAELRELADCYYAEGDQAAAVSSGSFPTDGMLVVPCSVKTLAAIAGGFAQNLLCRAADVTLKERRRLVLAVRETPLHAIHLRNMLTLTEMGAVIAPPVPAFYNRPANLEEVVDQTVIRLLDQFGLEIASDARWNGMPPAVTDATVGPLTAPE
ncbi:MAG TPA: UbiX family flavin prenyltransferase [Solirubrobacteraceae bacterium]|nr:UbiX family flavin prenyltransferase [Solirubrobacteraceae bacterium]